VREGCRRRRPWENRARRLTIAHRRWHFSNLRPSLRRSCSHPSAGAINFGEDTPWDHATRLEHLAGKYPLKIVGIADPLAEKAEAVLAARRAQPGDAARLYDDCRVFADYREMLETCRPDAVWVGVPPVVHGSLSGGKDIELQVRVRACLCVCAGLRLFCRRRGGFPGALVELS